ncbi:MAG: endonuclease/exonuclease/phosphatase family protein, partial [Bdellovibrionota bacterium]
MNLSAIFTVVNVVTLNIWGLPPIPGSDLAPHRTERVDRICSVLREQASDPKGWDIVLLQEAWVTRDRKKLANCGYSFVVDRDIPFALVDSGLMILSRYEIEPESIARRNFSVGGDLAGIFADGEILARKAGLIAKVLHPKVGPVWVANTHLIAVYDRAPDPDRYFSERQEQISEYLAWIQETVDRNPVIIGGDFNFGRGSRQWDWLKEKLPTFVQAPDADEFCTFQPEGSSEYLTRYDISK